MAWPLWVYGFVTPHTHTHRVTHNTFHEESVEVADQRNV